MCRKEVSLSPLFLGRRTEDCYLSNKRREAIYLSIYRSVRICLDKEKVLCLFLRSSFSCRDKTRKSSVHRRERETRSCCIGRPAVTRLAFLGERPSAHAGEMPQTKPSNCRRRASRREEPDSTPHPLARKNSFFFKREEKKKATRETTLSLCRHAC